MANRIFKTMKALEQEIIKLYLEVDIGATGAPTIVRGTGILSIVRTGAGDYLITLQDRYARLMMLKGNILDSTEEDQNITIAAESVDNATPTVTIFCLTGATATEMSDGSKLYLEITLKNSSVI